MDIGINFYLGFLIIFTPYLTQELTTAEYLTRNIRSNSYEEPKTTDSTILHEFINLNPINESDTQINNGTDYVNGNFIEDQIALESNHQKNNKGSEKYNILPSTIVTDISSLHESSNIDSDTPNSKDKSISYKKYTSSEIQDINSADKHEVLSEVMRQTSSALYDKISLQTQSNTANSRYNIFTSELTTPTTPIFDDHHYKIQKEIISNIKENNALLSTTNIPLPNINILETISPNQINNTISYENVVNIDQYDSVNATSRHSELIIENGTKSNIENKYLTNKVIIDTTLSPKVNELDYLTVSPSIKSPARFTIKTNDYDHNDKSQTSTIASRVRNSVKALENTESNEKNTIIKKPTVKWKPHYLSTQTPTSINPVYEKVQKNKTFTTNIMKRGSIKYSDTIITTTIPPETTTVTESDSIVQENQQTSFHILPPEENIFDILSSTEISMMSTTTDNPETTTLTEDLFDVEILDNSANDSVTNDSTSFTIEIDLTTENPSTTISNEMESTTIFTNRVSLLDTIDPTVSNYDFSTIFDLNTTTERILKTTVNNNGTTLMNNISNNNEINSELANSLETSTTIPESSIVTTNIPITSSTLESNVSDLISPNNKSDLLHSYLTKNTTLNHEDDNLSFINTQQSYENTIKTGKSNYLTSTSEEENDIKVKLSTTSSTTARSIIQPSSISTTINYKDIDHNFNNETDQESKIVKITTSVPSPISYSTPSQVTELNTPGYEYKYGHKTSENNVYKHFSTIDENNIHTNTPDTRIATSTTTETTIDTMEPLEDETNPITIIAIIIITIAAICLVLLALLLVIMRKRQKRFNYGQRCTPVSLDAYSLDSVSVYNSVRRKGAIRASKRSYGNPAFEDTENISHPMNFSKLANFANNDEGITKEYEDIPMITAQANEVPSGCELKNRYANVIPLPETRVHLTKIEGDINSDYINANYIRGTNNSKAFYIATQAPLESTIDDFWRMIWEQQSKLVIQVTDFYENGVEKCFNYLPPSEVLDCHRQFGDFQITLKKREVKEKYIIHSLQLKNMVSNSWREITHLWYLGWPERGTPSEVDSIIAFLIEARSYTKTNVNSNIDNDDDKIKESGNGYLSTGEPLMGPTPIVIHCSPGTGRTGTIIACDILMREFEVTRIVDVPKIVYRIRRDRAGAVQTKDQYAYIYKVINVYATKLSGGALDSI